MPLKKGKDPCSACGSRVHFRCIPAVPECTATFHGSEWAAVKLGCVCPDALEEKANRRHTPNPGPRKPPALTREERLARRRAKYVEDRRAKGEIKKKELAERASTYVDWVVVLRTLEGERGLITNELERDEVIKQATLRGFTEKETAKLAKIATHRVNLVRRLSGVKYEIYSPISVKEAERIVAA